LPYYLDYIKKLGERTSPRVYLSPAICILNLPTFRERPIRTSAIIA